MVFDFLEPESPNFYETSFLIVRLLTDSGRTELLVTNLEPGWFPLAALKRLYTRRRGIETSFRGLKYAVGLIHLHAKKPELILQEIEVLPLAMPRLRTLLSLRYTSVASLFGLLFVFNSCRHNS